MAPGDRAEHRLMRQRGAGITNVTSTAFSFSFARPAAPARKQKSRSRSPEKVQPSTSEAPRRSPQTTTNNDTQPATTPPVDTTAATNISASPIKTRTPAQQPSPTYRTPKVTGKRRRGSDDAEQQEQGEDDDLAQDDPEHVSSAERYGMAARRASIVSASPRETRELQEEDQLSGIGDESVASAMSTQKSLPSIIPNSQTPSQSATRRKSGRPRKSMAEGVPGEVMESSGQLEVIPDSIEVEKSQTPIPKTISQEETSLHQIGHVSPEPEPDLELDDLSPQQPVTKERKGRGRGRPRKASLNKDNNAAVATSATKQHNLGENAPEVLKPNEIGIQEETDDEPEGSDNASQERSDHLDTELDENEEERHESPPIPKTRSPRAKASKRSRTWKSRLSKPLRKATASSRKQAQSDDADAKPKRRKTEGGFVQLKVLRLSKPAKRRNTQDSDSGEESDDPLQDPSTYSVPGVSGADVLRNTVMETLDKSIRRLEDAAQEADDNSHAALHKRNAGYISKFKADIMSRLQPIVDRVDAGTRFKLDLRSKKREKARLREELLEIRKQHAEITLQMDTVREEHRKRTDSHKKNMDLNEALFDIDFAIQNGRQRAKELGRENEGPQLPLDMLMVDVASKVSSQQAGGGLSDKVKSFNEVLEKSAAIIEGRAY